MKKVTLSLVFVIALVCSTHAQKHLNLIEIEQEAEHYFKNQKYDLAAQNYLKLHDAYDFKNQRLIALYYAIVSLVKQEKMDRAFTYLDRVVIDYGYTDKGFLESDPNFEVLKSDARWQRLLNKIPEPKQLNDDPASAKIITQDIHNFWDAYDLAKKDPDNAYQIYKKYYFEEASDGMEDYMGLKVRSIQSFVGHIESHPKLYNSVREYTLKVDDYKAEIQKSFRNFKELYPDAKFPDVYFVIGAFTSGGTVSASGLLIGTNQMSDGPGVDDSELDPGKKLLFKKSETLPHVVAHELIHFQQEGLVRDTTTLGYVIEEGMADFLGELISGEGSNEIIFDWTKGREKEIWADFKEDMFYDRYSKWIGNYSNVSEDSYPDLGYWIGYEICKSYYEHSKDKKQAIYDMLHIQDYRKFLTESKWEEKVNKM